MEPTITTTPEKKLIGKRLAMSFAHNRTFELWNSFMPHRKEIANAIGTELYSAQQYPEGFFAQFNPMAEFDKWAAVEVGDLDIIPEGMEALVIPEGLYAVFIHTGGPATAETTFTYIMRDWLPKSGYQLDTRPHFEILGSKYKNDDPNSEEEVWIPIQKIG